MIFNRTFVFVHVKTFASHEKITPLLIRNRRFDDDQRARSTRSATGCRHLREIQGGNGGLYFREFRFGQDLADIGKMRCPLPLHQGFSSAVQQHRPTDCRFPREIEIEGSYRLCRGTDLHENGAGNRQRIRVCQTGWREADRRRSKLRPASLSG